MKKITIKFTDNSSIEVENEIRPVTILERLGGNGRKIIAVKADNEIQSLDTPVDISCTLEPVFLDTKEGSAIYRRSLCFVLAAAAQKLFPTARLLVGHSLGYGYYYTLDTGKPLSEDQISALKTQMDKIISEDKVIETEFISYKEACELLEKLNLTETRKQLNYRCPAKIKINRMDDFSDVYFGPLTSSTGCLKVFELKPYHEGFLLRFPKHDSPDSLTEFKDQPKLFQIYKRYKEWGKRLNVTSAASLNQLIHDRQITDFINITETLQVKCISDIAAQIQEKKTARVVLIAGPSSSGKTTTSKKLSLQLQALGYTPKVISLDSYYVGRAETPKDENGNYDYECLEALNIKLLNENLVDLFEGKTIKLPSYDFHEGVSYFKGDTMNLGPSDILVMEGIHGLNDKLTPLVPAEYKFKIYLSALTQLNLDDHNRIATSDNRLIRRIVRDSQFRGKSAADTIGMWDNVQKGERLHIFPFQNNADAMLNTALDYELAVLKVYAEPLLRCVTPNQKEYSEASRLLQFLNFFSTLPATAVPNQSIIREFIGGSAFHY
ncbi:MAG: nucleoside kinase [Treponema sp.]|uniref:Nucleoside kinase n=1 Tax=Treponema rectale TaxID=744512 RepID=A0A840S5B4_9SPIR|nr:nucleoside kinase [Treponema rectale]MBB5217689.1 uridine kinase [Treponema rectale]MBO6177114.1 nucleoside kinase [Treponema sp.]QOS40580.1 nucleoside kinase [Treponema rectale]